MALKKVETRTELREVVERMPARDEQGLTEQLHHPDPGLRRKAAIDLRDFPGAAPVLGAALVGEKDDEVRSAVLTTLSHLATESAALALLPHLRSEDAALRNGSIAALTRMPDAVASQVPVLLQDRDPDVRLMTLQLLSSLPHPGIREWLHEVLTRDADVNVLAAAIEVMAEVGEPDDVALLYQVAHRSGGDTFLSFVAETAMARIRRL